MTARPSTHERRDRTLRIALPIVVLALGLAIWELVVRIEDIPPGGMILPMSAVYPTSAPPGPAGRWLIERMKLCTGKPAGTQV